MTSTPPPAEGQRIDWADLPLALRTRIEGELGSPVVESRTQRGGFSPGLAARLTTADGRTAFLKAVHPATNELAPIFHRREARVVAALPESAPVPRLLWSIDEGPGGWVVLAFEAIAGTMPAQPWQPAELRRVMGALEELSVALTPNPLPEAKPIGSWALYNSGFWRQVAEQEPAGLDDWSRQHAPRLAELEADAAAASEGNTLLHLDLRADNMLLTPERVWVVDWPHARVGAPWVDLVWFAPSVAMQGGPAPEELLAAIAARRAADAKAVACVVAAMAGFFTWNALQAPPPGLPTLRPFQAAQAEVARAWLSRLTALG
jgi:aminoglycoside phosphotransferase (APT) family kinase protein